MLWWYLFVQLWLVFWSCFGCFGSSRFLVCPCTFYYCCCFMLCLSKITWVLCIVSLFWSLQLSVNFWCSNIISVILCFVASIIRAKHLKVFPATLVATIAFKCCSAGLKCSVIWVSNFDFEHHPSQPIFCVVSGKKKRSQNDHFKSYSAGQEKSFSHVQVLGRKMTTIIGHQSNSKMDSRVTFGMWHRISFSLQKEVICKEW